MKPSKQLLILGLISLPTLFMVPPIIWGSQSWQTASAASFGAPISGSQSYNPLDLPNFHNSLSFNNFRNISPFPINFTGLQLPSFDPFDLDNPAWKLEILEAQPLDSNPALLEGLKAQLIQEGHSPLQLALTDLVYAEGSKIPVSFTQVIQNEAGDKLVMTREGQKAKKNTAFGSFKAEKALFEAKNGHLETPGSVKKVDPPPEELVTSFTETWEDPKNGHAVTFDITNIDYQNGRWASAYEGVIKTENIKIDFNKTVTYDFRGAPQSATIELHAKGAPKVEMAWIKENPKHGPEGLQKMEKAFQTLVQNPKGMKPGQEAFEMTVKAADQKKSFFGLKKLAQWFLGLFTDHAGEMRQMKSGLQQLAQKDPKNYLLKVGFQDPSAMSYRDLKKVYTVDAASNNSKLTPPNKTFNPVRFVLRLPRHILKAAGTVVKFVMDLPVIRHVWHAQRRISGAIGGYLWGDNFDKKIPVNYSKEGPAVMGIGGVFSADVFMNKFKTMIGESFGIERVGYVRNNSYFLLDFVQSLFYEYLGSVDRPVLDAKDAMVKGIEEKGEVFVVAHSQGAGIAKQAIDLLSPEQRAKVHILTLGPQWIIDEKNEGLGSSKNIWNKSDFIPSLGNRIKFVTNLLLPWNWGRLSEESVVRSNTSEGHGVSNYKEGIDTWVQELRQRNILVYP